MKGTGSPAAKFQFPRGTGLTWPCLSVSVNEHLEVEVINSERENVCETL